MLTENSTGNFQNGTNDLSIQKNQNLVVKHTFMSWCEGRTELYDMIKKFHYQCQRVWQW